MQSLTPNSTRAESTKAPGATSEDIETQANKAAARLELKAAIEGLNRLARETAAKNPRQAA
jgi:hypothetical protein